MQIEPIGYKDVRLEDLSTEYQGMWSVHPTNSEHILIKNLSIHSTGGNVTGSADRRSKLRTLRRSVLTLPRRRVRSCAPARRDCLGGRTVLLPA